MKKLLYLFFFIGTLTTCSEVIDLDTDEQGGELVIFGRISNSHVGNYVKVTRTSNSGQAPIPVNDAQVRIYDQDDHVEELRFTGPGHYELVDKVLDRSIGKSFRLEVEIQGRLYTSSLQPINEVVARDELSWQEAYETDVTDTGTEIEQWVVQLFATSTIDVLPEAFYLRWTVEEAYTHLTSALPSSHYPRWTPPQCYVINDLSEQDIFLLDGTTVRNTDLNNRYLLSRRIDNTFAVRHYFNLIQSSLNKETYEYWSRVDGLVARAGSIFDTPPAALPSNITSSVPNERVLGHFEVIGVDTVRLRLNNNDIPIFFEDPCEIDTPREFFEVISVPFECVTCLIEEKILPLECVFCNLAPGFTGKRPSYF